MHSVVHFRVSGTTKLVKGVENKSFQKCLRERWLFKLEKKKLMGDLVSLTNYFRGGCSRVGVGFFSQTPSGKTGNHKNIES